MHWPPSDETDGKVAALAGEVTDWDLFLALTMRHRVELLVEHALSRIPHPAPERVRSLIAERATIQRRKSLLLAAASCELQAALLKRGIRSIALKGAPLGALAFGSVAMRQLRDIDILIRPEDRDFAISCLHESGFQRTTPAGSAGPSLMALWNSLRKDQTFRRGQVLVELHWRASENPYLFDIAWDPASWRSVPIGPVCALAVPDRRVFFSYLCIHGAVTGWHRLKWLADVGALLAQETADSIRDLLQYAECHGAGRAVGQALLLCRQLLGSEVPDDLLQKLSADSAVQRLTNGSLTALYRDGARERAQTGFASLGPALSRLSLTRSWRFKWREIVLAVANPEEAARIELPDRLVPFYPLLRLPIWLLQQWRLRAAKSGAEA
ncbi:MAG: nucleotidyltransferase family protein [Proteobacteria bacterium]|nr:nucleotidyltransferase family protein [Pseudomonadota bacterium]